MGSSLRKQLIDEYSTLRRENERSLNARIEEAEQAVPRIAELRARKQQLWADSVRDALLFGRQPDAEQLKQSYRDCDSEIAACLKQAGLPEDQLLMRYRCPVCKDNGYVGEPIHSDCECFTARLLEKLRQSANLSRPGEQTFESFDISRFSDELLPGRNYSQRSYMKRAREICENYADSFPNNDKPNLLLTGASGLGKTFLLSCIAQRVLDRGHAALYVTAYRMFAAMRGAAHNDPELFDNLMSTPLLIIDDLGTEPLYNNITTEYLFCLLNERRNSRLATLIATNYSPVEALQRYTERISSRMFDTSTTTILQLQGRDLRVGN